MDDRFVAVGRVAGPHGVRGGLKAAPYSGDPSGFVRARTVLLRRPPRGEDPGEERTFAVAGARPAGRTALLELEGMTDPESARAWTGAEILVPRESLPEPGEDEYYWDDLAGCEVVAPDGGRIGTVRAVEPGPAHDWLVVDRGGEEGLLPLVSAFVRSVDVRGRRIVATPPAGW